MELILDKWEKLLNQSEFGSFFQSPECFQFYQSLSFLNPFVIYVEDNVELKGLISGYVIEEGKGLKKRMTKRAIVYGGALLHKHITDLEFANLIDKLKSELIKAQVIYIELRNYQDYSYFKTAFQQKDFNFYPYLNFHVFTPDLKSALNNLHATKRRHVTSALRQGITCVQSTNEKDLDQFYILLKQLYRIKIKTPLYPLEFFRKVIEHGWTTFFVIKQQDQVVGGSLCVTFRGKVIYEWFVCGMDKSFKGMHPSTMATWMPIEYAATNGFDYFDMMGAGKPDTPYGVRDFKAQFGGVLVNHGRFLCVLSPFRYNIGKLVVKLLRSIKL